MLKRSVKSKCRKVRGTLSEYLDGTLNHEERNIIEQHLEMCQDCVDEFESLQMTVQMLHRMSAVPAPRSFAVTEVEKSRPSIFDPQNLRWLRPATAFVAIVLMVLLSVDFLIVGGAVPAVEELQTPPVSVPAPDAQFDAGELRGDMTSEVTPAPTPAPAAGVEGKGLPEGLDAGKVGSNALSDVHPVSAVQEDGWSPVRQAEVAVGALVLVLLSVLLFTRRWGVAGWWRKS